jgi:hypothetical protein
MPDQADAAGLVTPLMVAWRAPKDRFLQIFLLPSNSVLPFSLAQFPPIHPQPPSHSAQQIDEGRQE